MPLEYFVVPGKSSLGDVQIPPTQVAKTAGGPGGMAVSREDHKLKFFSARA